MPLAAVVGLLAAQPVHAQSVVFGGLTYVNKGLVGVGRVPAAQRDKFGETFGSLSALAIDLRTWRSGPNGTFTATIYSQPDRGYTPSGATTNFRPRRHQLTLTFSPDYNGSSHQDQVGLALTDTMLLTEADGTALTSMDPTPTGSGVRAGFPRLPQAFNGRISLDGEGLALLADGSFFVSDEYGPYIYRFSATGVLLGAIRPPDAFIPRRNGSDSFSSNSPFAGQPATSPNQPTTGRENNTGLEGLSLSADHRTLYGLMQSATRQDGGSAGAGLNRFARLLAYDVTNPASPALSGEWVLPLPLYADSDNVPRVAEQHELLALDDHRFLVIAHDSRGRGASTTKSLFRAVLVFDLGGSTNIAGTAFDTRDTPVAPNGVLAPGVVPASSTVLIDLNASAQLGKFGLNNNANDNSDTLSAQWESLALAPAFDPAAPDDYFLFIGNDNNYSTTSGFQDGASYSSSPNIDSMVLAYRVTLPQTASGLPTFTLQPAAQTIATGSTVVFSAATASAASYQWRRNGSPIPGETNRLLMLRNAQPADAASYSAVATNSFGSATSVSAALTVMSVTPADNSRLVNLSVLSAISDNEPSFTIGTVLGGTGTTGPKPLLVRAAGPSLTQFGVATPLDDPRLDVFSGSALLASNDNWDGTAPLASAFNAVGAFAYVSPLSRDAAIYLPTISSGDLTARISTAGAARGAVIGEIYDATPAAAMTATTPRLLNVSVLKQVPDSGALTAGFVIAGSVAKTVLIRAIGPRLALPPFGIPGVMSDPKLDLFLGADAIASNDDWGGDSQLATAGSLVGAFSVTDAASKDAMLLITLRPGNYTAQASSASGAGGLAIVEIYEVP